MLVTLLNEILKNFVVWCLTLFIDFQISYWSVVNNFLKNNQHLLKSNKQNNSTNFVEEYVGRMLPGSAILSLEKK